MLEQKIQAKITKRLQSDGWVVVKLLKTTMNGIPDLMALKDGVTKFIEVKQPTGVLSEIQKLRVRQLREMGFDVNIWIDYNQDYEIRN
jgi:Holliday junction resolvase